MADYGLRVWDAAGNIQLDLTDRITRLRYSTTAAAGVAGSIDLPDITGLESAEFSVLLTTDVPYCPHSVLRSGTTISWSPTSGDHYSSGDSCIFVFLFT